MLLIAFDCFQLLSITFGYVMRKEVTGQKLGGSDGSSVGRSLTNASDAKEEASMAEVVFGRLELFGSFEISQLFTHGTSIG